MKNSRLFKNLVDSIEENQLKLGYRKESIRLYYPENTIRHLLGTEAGGEELCKILREALAQYEEQLGKTGLKRLRDGRIGLILSEKASEYVHEHVDPEGFLAAFIALIARHGSTMPEVIQLFHAYSDHVHEEASQNEEFDRLLYFTDGVPDDYYYCIADEGHHLSYHRFIKEDYLDFDF